ncbi:MAG: hypothetical protein PUF28_02690 [bacterium]|nr:hypothetical protein [bacterium]
MKRIQQNIMRYGLLLASLVMLMSVIVPHHHHEDGRPCCISLTEQGEDPDDEHESTHDCGCEGHNLAVYRTILLRHMVETCISFGSR